MGTGFLSNVALSVDADQSSDTPRVILSYKVNSPENRIENNPDRLFPATSPTDPIRNVVELVDERDNSGRGGSFVLSGPAGSGKSHALVTLYHVLRSPATASGWLEHWGIEYGRTEGMNCVMVSMQDTDPDYIWEPIFEGVGADDFLEEVDRYPTVDLIEEVVGDDALAIFIDNLGTWWDSFDLGEDKEKIRRNEMFLTSLLEVTTYDKLFLFLTSQRYVKGLDDVLNRAYSHREYMSMFSSKRII